MYLTPNVIVVPISKRTTDHYGTLENIESLTGLELFVLTVRKGRIVWIQ